jgi:glycosyltransferase involved in cell wall biosynthesis
MRVSIVVAVKDQSENLRQCLSCLSLQHHKNFETIVIDNNSSRDESRAIRALCKEFGAVYDFEVTPGCHAARNRGLSHVTGDLIGFTDADCRPWESWISGAVMAIETYQYQAVAGHVNFTFSQTPIPIGELIDSFTHLQQEEYAAQGYGAGANLWVRRQYFDMVGPFRSDMLRLGDREWGQRARGFGVNVRYSALTTIDHPARNWEQLLTKIWDQAEWKHFLIPYTWRDIFTAAIVPRQNYQGAMRDRRLPGLRKIRFLLALHWIGIMQSVRVAQLLLRSPQRPTKSPTAITHHQHNN